MHLGYRLTNTQLTRRCQWTELSQREDFSDRSILQSLTQSELRHRSEHSCSFMCNSTEFAVWNLSSHFLTRRRKGVCRIILNSSLVCLDRSESEMMHWINLGSLFTERSSSAICQDILMTHFQMKWWDFTGKPCACTCVRERTSSICNQANNDKHQRYWVSGCWKCKRLSGSDQLSFGKRRLHQLTPMFYLPSKQWSRRDREILFFL